jgi:hypothetical protein
MKGQTKGQAFVYSIILGVVGLVIAAQVLFSQLATVKSAIGNASCTNTTGTTCSALPPMTSAEASLATLTPLIMIAGFLLVVVGVFLYSKNQ